ncbi:MAG: peptidoglycan-binding domain-containing protein [Myxococcales bacterium]
MSDGEKKEAASQRLYQAQVRAQGKATSAVLLSAAEVAKAEVPDDHGNPIPVTWKFKVQTKEGAVTTAVVIRTSEPEQVELHLLVQDEEGHPHRKRPFEVSAAGKQVTGTTTDEGIVDVSFPRAPEVKLTVQGEQGAQVFRLMLGALKPAAEVLGAQQRLQALGYALRASGKLDDETKKAVSAFRLAQGLKDGTALDDETTRAVDAAYAKEMKGGR